jgi:hypothetical protein
MSAANKEALIDWQRELDRDPAYAEWSDMVDKTAKSKEVKQNESDSERIRGR